MTNQIQKISRGGAEARRPDTNGKERLPAMNFRAPKFSSASAPLRLCASNSSSQKKSRGLGRGFKKEFSPLVAFDQLSQARGENATKITTRGATSRRREVGAGGRSLSTGPSEPSLCGGCNSRSQARRRLPIGGGLLNFHPTPAKSNRRIVYWVCFAAIWTWSCAVIVFCTWRFR
jgi:hypothetical protein